MRSAPWLLALPLLAAASPAAAQTTLLDGFGGTAGYGADCLGPNDDGSSMAIDLTPVFPDGIQFFDATHTTMYVNTNGNVSFGGGLPDFTPEAFPIADQPMIAPYWADVDIRGGLCDSYPDGRARGGGDTYAGDCHDPSSNGVWWHLDPTGGRAIVTWDRVGYYRCHTNRQMSFQLVMTRVEGETCGAGGDFDVEFRYAECEWNTGDASGGDNGLPRDPAECVRPAGVGPWRCPIGILQCQNVDGTRICEPVPAQAGFDAGNTADFVEIEGSRTATVHTDLCTGSNVGETGVWRFEIRSGVVECPEAGDPCDTGLSGACQTGRTQCVGGGLECRPEVAPVEESCDALDNDCDGTVDEGSLCAEGEVCDRGVCVTDCFEGGCFSGQVCTEGGLCVDEGCEAVECAQGERCVAGSCVGACDGVTCPAERECRAGRCVDLCAGATCDECTVCEGGDCVPRCDVSGCSGGQVCAADGHCVDPGCETTTCEAGFVCEGGTCVDACTGAVCPEGEECAGGECVESDAPPGGDAGTPRADGGSTPPGVDAGSVTPGIDGGAAPDGSEEDGGCGCRAAGMPTGHDAPLAPLAGLSVLGLLIAWRRRR